MSRNQRIIFFLHKFVFWGVLLCIVLYIIIPTKHNMGREEREAGWCILFMFFFLWIILLEWVVCVDVYMLNKLSFYARTEKCVGEWKWNLFLRLSL